MNDNVENLILSHLKDIRSRLDSMENRMTSLEQTIDERFDDQTQRVNGIAMILTMLAGHVHGIEERVEALEKRQS
jgi:hypothetical protein